VANWYGRDIKMRRGMKGSLSGSLASLGAATPYAMAAKMAFPDRTVIAFIGTAFSDPAIISGAALSNSRLPQRRPALPRARNPLHGGGLVRRGEHRVRRPERPARHPHLSHTVRTAWFALRTALCNRWFCKRWFCKR